MRSVFLEEVRAQLAEIERLGLTKVERPLHGPQGPRIKAGGGEALNFCANDYLGLANHPELIAAATGALAEWGFGLASVRFIAGTQDIHLELERRISELLGTESTILFPSCFDANGAVFEVLLGADDAVISDELNHASIIDGIRLSKAARYRYRNRDMGDLESQLVAASGAHRRLIVTDGVFSMDGSYAPLPEICDLADRYDALVMVDDSHAVGLIGAEGGGTPELFGVTDRVDLLSGTLGKALGGASGGYVSGPSDVVNLLRQRARPYLFSNAVPPSSVAGALAAIGLDGLAERRRDLATNALAFRSLMEEAGFVLLPGEHPIVPVMFEREADARAMADALLTRGIYVTAFSYPVVPLGRPRIRVQLSAAHTHAEIARCVEAFVESRAELA